MAELAEKEALRAAEKYQLEAQIAREAARAEGEAAKAAGEAAKAAQLENAAKAELERQQLVLQEREK